MPSSLICCSEDSSLEPQELQIKAHGARASNKHDDLWEEAFPSSTSQFNSLEVASAAVISPSTGLLPTVGAFASLIEEIDSPPSLESFCRSDLPPSGNLRYFLDLKTPGSAGSAAAHHIYRPKTQEI